MVDFQQASAKESTPDDIGQMFPTGRTTFKLPRVCLCNIWNGGVAQHFQYLRSIHHREWFLENGSEKDGKRRHAVATSPLALRWMCASPRTGCARRITPICTWREQAIIEWSRRVISIVACCHNVKLCALSARAFRPQQRKRLVFDH